MHLISSLYKRHKNRSFKLSFVVYLECLNLVKYLIILFCSANRKHYIFTQKPTKEIISFVATSVAM